MPTGAKNFPGYSAEAEEEAGAAPTLSITQIRWSMTSGVWQSALVACMRIYDASNTSICRQCWIFVTAALIAIGPGFLNGGRCRHLLFMYPETPAWITLYNTAITSIETHHFVKSVHIRSLPAGSFFSPQ